MHGIGRTFAALCLSVLAVPVARAQSKPHKPMTQPRYDLAIGYNNIRANAPPGHCDCFDTNGGFLSAGMHFNDWFGVGAEITDGTNSDIGPLGQGLVLTTFTAGPRFNYNHHRLAWFGEFLLGEAHGSDSYFPTLTTSRTNASSFTFSTGGGLDVELNQRFAVRALQVQYLRTTFPNGVNNEENHLMLGAGLTVKFRAMGRRVKPVPVPVAVVAPAPPPPAPEPAPAPAPPPPPPPPMVVLACSTNVANVPLGQMVVITGDARTEPRQLALGYAWETSGGSVEGSGNVVSINTTGMSIGDYRVKGHATLVASPAISADCVAVFRVVPVEAPPAPSNTYITNVNASTSDKEFHEHVKDVYFAVNSAVLRPSAVVSISRAAKYLKAHPEIHVLASGWTDPRGSVKFNIALGVRRANAVHSALLRAGVPAEQLEMISNGKSSQVCATTDQDCWQQNRRVSFSMKP